MLTYRKLHLLQAEWAYRQHLTETRFCNLMCAWGCKPDEARALFPFLNSSESKDGDGQASGAYDPEEDIDNERVFSQVSAVHTPPIPPLLG